jgi:DNA-binding MarR family transcriptional regulator
MTAYMSDMKPALYELIWNTRPLLQHIERAVQRGLEGTDLTVRMRAVMEILDRDGAQPVPALARALDIKRQYVQIMVDETTAAGMTDRHKNSAHSRSPLIALTPVGDALIRRVRQEEDSRVSALMKGLKESEVLVALQVQRRLLDAFSKMGAP